jgi:aminoglycoside phosphotransferase (APT) family kinase protein
MRRRVPAALERLEEVELLGLWGRPASLDGWLPAARELPGPPASCVAHGDLHLRHVLVDARGRPTGVIDWGDLCRADPAVDLPLYWSALPPRARGEFVAVYGRVDAEALLRARVLAVFLCATLAVYAHREGMRALTREAISGLARACED